MLIKIVATYVKQLYYCNYNARNRKSSNCQRETVIIQRSNYKNIN